MSPLRRVKPRLQKLRDVPDRPLRVVSGAGHGAGPTRVRVRPRTGPGALNKREAGGWVDEWMDGGIQSQNQ